MAGHSQWKNIQHRKSIQDRKKAKHYAGFSQTLYSTGKSCGTDSQAFKNLLLRAPKMQIPSHIVQRTLDKLNGKIQADQLYQGLYEFRYQDLLMIVKCEGDNKNRIISKLKTCCNNNNITSNGTMFAFHKSVTLIIKKNNITEEDIIEDFDNIVDIHDCGDIYVLELDKHGAIHGKYVVLFQDITYIPKDCILNNDKYRAILDKIYDLDDVQDIFHNVSYIPYSLMTNYDNLVA